MEHFNDLQKAQDAAKWETFKYRQQEVQFDVVHGPCDDFVVCNLETAEELETTFIPCPSDYSDMPFEHIRSIRTDKNPLNHWEEISGMISTIHGETLRFILEYKIPLDKWIRYELAARGYDENHEWVGFDKAEEVWLKEN